MFNFPASSNPSFRVLHFKLALTHLHEPTSKVHLQAPHTPHPSHRSGIAFPPPTCPPQPSKPLPPLPHLPLSHQPPTPTPNSPTDSTRSTPISTRQPPLPSRSSGFQEATSSRRGTTCRWLPMPLLILNGCGRGSSRRDKGVVRG